MPPRILTFCFLLTILAAPTPALGQGEKRIGLALSGGGARAFAQIGVLQVLEEEGIQVNAIAGSSMGSIVGGLYAIGYAPHEIAELATSQDWGTLFALSAPRRRRPLPRRVLDDEFIFRLAIREGRPALPSSFLSGQSISMLLSRLTLPYHDVDDFSRLPIPFSAVATNVETGGAVVLNGGYLAEAIRASITVPSAMTPVRIGDTSLIDGGIARNLPAVDARALGADVVICVNASRDLQAPEELESIPDMLNQVISYQIDEHVDEQKPACDVYVEPWLDQRDSFDFTAIEEIIKAGYEAADSLRYALRDLAGRQYRPPDHRAGERASVSTYDVREVRVTGLNEDRRRRVADVLSRWLPGEADITEIESAIDAVYSSGPFRQVLYRLVKLEDTDAYALRVDVTEHNEGQLGISLRYDSRYKASALISVMMRNRVGYGPSVRGALRLGEIPMLRATFVEPLTYRRPFTLRLTAQATGFPIDTFIDGVREAQSLVASVELRPVLATVLLRHWAATAGLRLEAYDIDHRIGERISGDRFGSVVGPEASLLFDSHDREAFPLRGQRVEIRALWAVNPVDGSVFSRYYFDWDARYLITDKTSLLGRLSLGRAGDGVAPHHRFFLGGPFEQPVFEGRLLPLFGAGTHEISGPNMQAIAAGIQLQLNDAWFASAQWNAGWAGTDWEWSPRDFRPGFGVSVGRTTFLVPAVVAVGSRGLTGPYELWLNLGYVF